LILRAKTSIGETEIKEGGVTDHKSPLRRSKRPARSSQKTYSRELRANDHTLQSWLDKITQAQPNCSRDRLLEHYLEMSSALGVSASLGRTRRRPVTALAAATYHRLPALQRRDGPPTLRDPPEAQQATRTAAGFPTSVPLTTWCNSAGKASGDECKLHTDARKTVVRRRNKTRSSNFARRLSEIVTLRSFGCAIMLNLSVNGSGDRNRRPVVALPNIFLRHWRRP
jgi:hypothetical protein